MAFSSSSIGDLGLPRVNISNGEIGEVKKLLFLADEEGEEEEGESEPTPKLPPLLSMISSFLALCLRSCSLKAGRRGPAGPGPVTGSFNEDESWAAPVSRWTTARKLDGSAWTKVVLGVDEFGSEAMI